MDIALFDWQIDVYYEAQAKFNIIPAGRRTGKTQGAAGACTIFAAEGDPCLWVDTVYSNIDRYVERYFLPPLRASDLSHSWNSQKKLLKIENGYIDFRSADRPETIEGFGYRRIFLNEAGIILHKDYLYINSILPMLMDFPDSKLYAFGTPKGQKNKKGGPHRFYELWKRVLNNDENYGGRQLSSYDNPKLRTEDIDLLRAEIKKLDPDAEPQEIGGQFIEQKDSLVFPYSDLDFFRMEDLNLEHKVAGIGAIDPADEGVDSYSFPLGYLIGKKIYIVDWLFTKENTRFTNPASTGLMRKHRLEYCAIETNNHGSVIFKDIQDEILGTTLLEVNQQTKKHSRIIQNAGFIKDHFVFRSDYEEDSDYAKAMTQLMAYLKDGSLKKDDAPDSVALLASVARDLFGSTWYGV